MQTHHGRLTLRRFSRRSFLHWLAASGVAVSQVGVKGSPSRPEVIDLLKINDLDSQSQSEVSGLLKINDLDRRIWSEELDGFVPRRIYDMHSHLTRAEFNLDPEMKLAGPDSYRLSLPSGAFKKANSVELLDTCEALLYPGRTVTRLITPNPHRHCDFDASNEFIAREALKKQGTPALMVVHPKMTAEEVDRAVVRHRFFGFKPYRWYSLTGDTDECRIRDFMPEHQVAVANRYGLMILLHISKKASITDPENLDDLERFTEKYPRVHWQLAHCARSYSAWALERAIPRLRRIPNLWYDTSSVCETDAFDALFSLVDLRRICYGSDDFAVGVTRGKYISYGYSWGEMNELNQNLNKSHCDGRMTFVRYEMLRAMRRAAQHARLNRLQIESIFYNNAARLIGSVRRSLTQALALRG